MKSNLLVGATTVFPIRVIIEIEVDFDKAVDSVEEVDELNELLVIEEE